MNNLSVIVPIFNTSKEYLKKCIDSLICIKDYSIEIVLVDDCSTKDETISICKEYSKNYSFVNYLRLDKNQGVSNARNQGIKACKNDWIMFVDSDDWVNSDCYDIVFKKVDKKKDVTIFDADVVFESKKCRNKFLCFSNETYVDDFSDIKRQIIYKFSASYVPEYNCVGVTWAKVFRKKFLIDNNLYFNVSLKRAEDHVFTLGLLDKNPVVYYVPVSFYNYRKNDESTVNKYNKNVKETFNKTLFALRELIGNDSSLKSIYYRRCVSYIIGAFTNDYFHKDNKMGYYEIKEDLKVLKEMQLYKEVLDLKTIDGISIKEKVLLFLLKNNLFVFIYLYYKLKILFKRVK